MEVSSLGHDNQTVHLRDLWRKHEGARFAIIGNGPSAANVTRERALENNDIVIGTNRMWAWNEVDYYTFVGMDIAEQVNKLLHKTPDHPITNAHWVIPAYRHQPPSQPQEMTHFHRRRGMPIHRRVTQEMVERPWVDRDHPQLIIHRSIILTACQLAMIMGARSIELFGCEGVAAEDGTLNFTGPRQICPGRSTKMAQIREALDNYYRDWSGKVQLWNSSEGYEGIWEARRRRRPDGKDILRMMADSEKLGMWAAEAQFRKDAYTGPYSDEQIQSAFDAYDQLDKAADDMEPTDD